MHKSGLAGLIAVIMVFVAQSPRSMAQSQSTGTKLQGPPYAFPLAKTAAPPPRKLTPAELSLKYRFFQHKDYNKSGFNPLSLPFRYEGADGANEDDEAQAFAFLLSASMDWISGNYCTRHAYFVFKHPGISGFADGYDPERIATEITEWKATHAVGGLLRRHKDGYSGTLEIYGPEGNLLLQKDFPQSREFFTLLGDMAVETFGFFGVTPTPAMVEHLHRKRCKEHQSILDLGVAAFVDARSEEEFGLYRRVLQRDPEFADVRYWRSNQKYWEDDDRMTYEGQVYRSMQSYLTETALSEMMHNAFFGAPERSGQCQLWLKQAEQLAPDHPTLARLRLDWDKQKSPFPFEDLDRATAIARDNPNQYWLLNDTADAYTDNVHDNAMAASIRQVAAESRYLLATSEQSDNAMRRLAADLLVLGEYATAAEYVKALQEEDGESGADVALRGWILGEIYENTGRHAEAVDAYRAAFHAGSDDKFRMVNLLNGVFSAAMAGKLDALEQILQDHQQELTRWKILPLVEVCRGALAGKAVAIPAPSSDEFPFLEMDIIKALIYSNLDVAAGKHEWQKRVEELLGKCPHHRLLWIMLDLYDRLEPQPRHASFYAMLSWLHPEDPWVVQAAADFRKRVAKPEFVTAEELLKQLANYPTKRWPAPRVGNNACMFITQFPPGCVDAAVDRLIRTREYDKAAELTLRYHSLAVDLREDRMECHANYLIHLLERISGKTARCAWAETPSSVKRQKREEDTGSEDDTKQMLIRKILLGFAAAAGAVAVLALVIRRSKKKKPPQSPRVSAPQRKPYTGTVSWAKSSMGRR